jgi:hypothetical protein
VLVRVCGGCLSRRLLPCVRVLLTRAALSTPLPRLLVRTHPCPWPTPAGGFPVVLNNLWLGREEGQAVAAALVPKLQKTKVAVEQLLFEVATLEVRVCGGGAVTRVVRHHARVWCALGCAVPCKRAALCTHPTHDTQKSHHHGGAVPPPPPPLTHTHTHTRPQTRSPWRRGVTRSHSRT